MWKSIDDLAKAQRRTEEHIDALTEAQHRTEERVNALAEAQCKTEERLNALVLAQERAEKRLNHLIEEHAETRRRLGGFAMTVGYVLESEAFKALPDLLRRDYGVEIEGRLKRQFVADKKGSKLGVNIFGTSRVKNKVVTIVGESKVHLSKNDVNEFVRKRLKRFEGVFEDIFPIIVTHMITDHDVEEYARNKGVAIYYSYDF
ncbi:MAG: hypothetical protein JRI31_10770 [Deltaproteobacteria bacterium]|nr:hypothetical protein [Deltaproteobacteria bacterium]